MNYYEHHIGDYDQATAHLTACEDGIYSRLIRRCMANEKPLPPDLPAIQRLVRAHSREEKKAVQTVLAEFFELLDDGYHQKRCDVEIARFQDKQRKAKASADARWSHTERNANASANASANAMRTHSERNANGMHRAPVPTPQTPDTSITPTLAGGPPTAAKSERNADPKPKTTKTPIPPDFGISARLRKWADSKGYGQLEQHLEAFRAKVAANAYRYADWDAAFAEAIREDWAKLRGRAPNGAAPPGEGATTHNPAIQHTQQWLARQAEAAANATPPPASILALRSRKQQGAQ